MMIEFLTRTIAIGTLALISTAATGQNAHATPDAFVGQVILVASNFCPRGFAETNGQLIDISKNTALFSLLGTTYGGDGRTTFALPDLRGRAPIHAGKGPGLPVRNNGDKVPQAVTPPYKESDATLKTSAPTLVMQYCIAVNGIYPSRN